MCTLHTHTKCTFTHAHTNTRTPWAASCSTSDRRFRRMWRPVDPFSFFMNHRLFGLGAHLGEGGGLRGGELHASPGLILVGTLLWPQKRHEMASATMAEDAALEVRT